MSIPAQVFRTHIDYSAWADAQLVESAGGLSHEELNRDFHTAARSVLGTLVHVFAADRLWLARLAKSPHQEFTTAADYNISVLQDAWPALHQRWREWGAALTDESMEAQLAYTDLAGNSWIQPVWQLVLHVVNHATHHRGQVAGFLRAMGHTPPVLDLHIYYRESP